MSPQIVVEHAQAPAVAAEDYYRQAEAAGRKIFRVDPARSLVTILVQRDGPLANLGHAHLIASHDVKGYIDLDAGRADLYVPLDRLTVDEQNLRQEIGLTTPLSSGAIEGTRRNMLDKVLEAGRYPVVLIQVTRVANDRSRLYVKIMLQGKVHDYEVPAQIETFTGGIVISGQMTFNQTDFGIIPFSILGGAIQVQDRLDLRFKIHAS
jgi:hypothetical protein